MGYIYRCIYLTMSEFLQDLKQIKLDQNKRTLNLIRGPRIDKTDRKEGNVLFNDALNTFYLRLYGVAYMVKDHSDS